MNNTTVETIIIRDIESYYKGLHFISEDELRDSLDINSKDILDYRIVNSKELDKNINILNTSNSGIIRLNPILDRDNYSIYLYDDMNNKIITLTDSFSKEIGLGLLQEVSKKMKLKIEFNSILFSGINCIGKVFAYRIILRPTYFVKDRLKDFMELNYYSNLYHLLGNEKVTALLTTRLFESFIHFSKDINNHTLISDVDTSNIYDKLISNSMYDTYYYLLQREVMYGDILTKNEIRNILYHLIDNINVRVNNEKYKLLLKDICDKKLHSNEVLAVMYNRIKDKEYYDFTLELGKYGFDNGSNTVLSEYKERIDLSEASTMLDIISNLENLIVEIKNNGKPCNNLLKKLRIILSSIVLEKDYCKSKEELFNLGIGYYEYPF